MTIKIDSKGTPDLTRRADWPDQRVITMSNPDNPAALHFLGFDEAGTFSRQDITGLELRLLALGASTWQLGLWQGDDPCDEWPRPPFTIWWGMDPAGLETDRTVLLHTSYGDRSFMLLNLPPAAIVNVKDILPPAPRQSFWQRFR